MFGVLMALYLPIHMLSKTFLAKGVGKIGFQKFQSNPGMISDIT